MLKMLSLPLVAALALGLAGCNAKATVASPTSSVTTSGLSSTQQLVAGAALSENAVSSGLVLALQSFTTAEASGIVSAADLTSVQSWLSAVAKQNDNAIALTQAAASGGATSGLSAALLSVATAIGQEPSLADVKSSTSQAAVQAIVASLLSDATSITSEFGGSN